MKTINLTMSQALTKWMINQKIEQFSSKHENAFAGVWGIFGHGNVAGLGEALFNVKDKLPTFRGHNEQGMAHAAISFAKQKKRRQMMAVTSSISPRATNFLTACAFAYVNRLPVLFLPGDIFANRLPDPVLQQDRILLKIEKSGAGCSGVGTQIAVKNLILAELIFKNSCQAMQSYQVLPSPRFSHPLMRANEAVRQSVAYAC